MAQIWAYSDGHIVQGVTKMNDSYSMDDPTKRYVMCQEVGHTFGLGHQDENHDNKNLGSCMDYSRYPGGNTADSIWGNLSNEHPNAHDFELLKTVYGHPDGSSTLSGASAGSGSPGRSEEAGNSQAEWGRPVRFDRHGTPILFRKDLDANRHLLTWVLWERGHGRSGR